MVIVNNQMRQNIGQQTVLFFPTYLIIQMKNIMFESPFLRFSNYELQLHRNNEQNDVLQESPICQEIHPVSQGLSSHPHNTRFQARQLSPWTAYNMEGRSQFDFLTSNYRRPFQANQIQDIISYSEEQPVTPVNQMNKVENEQAELHTTARRSQVGASNNRKSRPREKGLRKLSQRAYEIVLQMRYATYKQVASKLVNEMNEEQSDQENKDQQNIKRRVYDALNVLIALGVLRKDGRKIISDKVIKKDWNSKEAKQLEQLQLLKKKMIIKQKNLEEKRKKLREVNEKFKAITALMKRNECEKIVRVKKILPFPFIGFVITNFRKENAKLSLSSFQMQTYDRIQPFGDIDSLRWLKQYLDKEQLNNKNDKK